MCWNYSNCFRFGGKLSGIWCSYAPDIFFFSVTLFFGTFLLALYLKAFKYTSYFPSSVSLNFINVLSANFFYDSAFRSFSLMTDWLCNFSVQEYRYCRVCHRLTKQDESKFLVWLWPRRGWITLKHESSQTLYQKFGIPGNA